MKRRSKAGGGPAKGRLRKALKPTRRNASKAIARPNTSNGGKETEVARLTRELSEALEQQAATSDVLNVIGSSPGELEQVFRAILEKATRICEANFGVLFRLDDGVIQTVVRLGVPPALGEYMQPGLRPGLKTATARAIQTGHATHILDIREDKGYLEGDPMLVAGADRDGIRTLLAVPMLHNRVSIGSIGIYRTEVRPFTDKQIELVQNFAAQAVIAIENARLLNELRQRTADLTEALERQTATAEILASISGSITDARPVFEAILDNLLRLFGTRFALVLLVRDGMLEIGGIKGGPDFEKYAEYYPQPLDDRLLPGRAILVGRALQLVPIVDNPEAPSSTRKFAREFGFDALISVPLIRQGEVIGALSTAHRDPVAFTDKQIALIKSFADQAVIAIENTRLLNDLSQRTTDLTERTTDLTEALEQQTATSELLQVISSSPDDLAVVFRTMLENAVRICEANFGVLLLYEGLQFRVAAAHNPPPAFAELRRRQPEVRSSGVLARLVATKQLLHIPDCIEDTSYRQGDADFVEFVDLCRVRTLLGVPMLKDEELIGVIGIYRQEVRPFAEKQVALLGSFAAQAVIAIENARLLNELRQRTTDLTEALEQQTATSEVLKVISGSPSDLRPVFEAMLENATRICQASLGTMTLYENGGFRHVALHGAPPAYAELRAREPVVIPKAAQGLGRLASTKQVVHIADILSEPPEARGGLAQLASARTLLIVPMLKEEELVGSFGIYRQEMKPFTDKQIALVQNFAAQAVIAIENARLLNELRQRTTDLAERTNDLAEALEQQTATTEVLQVISSSPGDLEPVFAAMLVNAVRISGAKFGIIHSWDGEYLRLLASYNLPPALEQARKGAPEFKPGPKTGIRRMASTKSVIHIPDLREDDGYREEPLPQFVAAVELGGVRTMLIVPMLKENEVVGIFTVYRQEVRDFTEKQIELVKNFAAQAVIAIENARLLNELRQRTTDLTERTTDLTEALEQQTATSDVLQVISSSPGDVEPVFASMLERAVRICDAAFGNIYRWDGDAFYLIATHKTPPAFAEARRRSPSIQPNPKTPLGQLAVTKTLVHCADIAGRRDIEQGILEYQAAVELGGIKAYLAVPMLKESELVGALILSRQEVGPFTDKQIELIKNFAAQAVIAIENARLLNELRQSLEQQTATSEVLEVISSSPGELDPVFQAMLENATRICEAKFGSLFRFDGGAFRLAAGVGAPPELAEFQMRRGPFLPTAGGRLDHVMRTKQMSHTSDAAAEAVPGPAARYGGARSHLVVPMLKDDGLVGAIAIYRQEVRPFTDEQIALVQNFANQAVIAIENARLLSELRQSLQQQTATADVLRGRFEIGRQACSSPSKAFASFRSRVSKPSVNQP